MLGLSVALFVCFEVALAFLIATEVSAWCGDAPQDLRERVFGPFPGGEED